MKPVIDEVRRRANNYNELTLQEQSLCCMEEWNNLADTKQEKVDKNLQKVHNILTKIVGDGFRNDETTEALAKASKGLTEKHKLALEKAIDKALTAQKGVTTRQREASELRESIGMKKFRTKQLGVRGLYGEPTDQWSRLGDIKSHEKFLLKAFEFYSKIKNQADDDRPRIEMNKEFLKQYKKQPDQ